MTTSRFAHHRLDAYRVALELFSGVEEIASAFPRGHGDLRDQLRRAAAAVVRHIAEGANRYHSADKAARFIVAKGEVGECDAVLEMAGILGLAPAASIARLRGQADRVAAMLTGLVRRERRDCGWLRHMGASRAYSRPAETRTILPFVLVSCTAPTPGA